MASKKDQTAGSEYGGTNPYLIAVLVSVATFMEVLDTTIANVALRYISGGLAVSPDEAAWVVTTYLVANAIVLCASNWLVKIFGRKNFFMACTALFTVSSACCGFAWNLPVAADVPAVPGARRRRHDAGGAINSCGRLSAESEGARIRDLRDRGRARAGDRPDARRLAQRQLVVALVLPDQCARRPGLLAAVALFLPSSPERKKQREAMRRTGEIRFDLPGFILVSMFLGGLELVLDRGQEYDWFGSKFIVASACASGLGLLLFIPWELSRKDPLIDLRLLVSRQFGTCFLIMLRMGAVRWSA